MSVCLCFSCRIVIHAESAEGVTFDWCPECLQDLLTSSDPDSAGLATTNMRRDEDEV